ncbi:MAG: hypothetical protein HZB82_07030 [Deltaproteobacteria bacterium]|nr:hypothetical protein [Deltaproteobacteria bacterium]
MKSMNLTLALIGIAYGCVLIAATFVNNRFIAAFRLDTLFAPNRSSDSTKGINLVAGLALIGYNLYILIR